jgi:hypothetical protein
LQTDSIMPSVTHMEGAKNVIEHGGAYWLLDIIAIGAVGAVAGIDADDIADSPPEM